MLLIEDYIKLPQATRQSHLDLMAPCIERGGPSPGRLSTYLKGLVAHLLDTSIPNGHTIHVCHACNNAACSNPKHLYWGTASENCIDKNQNGSKTVWECMVNKHGEEKAREILSVSKKGNQSGTGNKNKPKSEEHRKKISQNHKGGRKKQASVV